MDHLAIQILAFVKANPGWAIFVIGLTAFGESFVFLSLCFREPRFSLPLVR